MTPEEIDNALSELSNRMERVRALYEQYFMGIERLEPTIPRKDLDRRLELLRRTRFQNTAKRFLYQTLVQRYTSLQQYWIRTCRDIENGTYKKHVKKAQRRFEEQSAPSSYPDSPSSQHERAALAQHAKSQAESDLSSLLDSNVDVQAELKLVLSTLEASPSPAKSDTARKETGLLGSLGKREPTALLGLPPLAQRATTAPKALPELSKRPPAPAAPAHRPSSIPMKAGQRIKLTSERPPAAPPAAPTGLTEERIKALHAQYQSARQQTNATAVSYEKMERNLRDTEAQLRARHQGKNIDFDVAIKDGKAILKPRVK